MNMARRLWTGIAASVLLVSCASSPPPQGTSTQTEALMAAARASSVFGPTSGFDASPLEVPGQGGLHPVRGPDECEVAMLESGEGSYAARIETLRAATVSIRIQALVFKGDESGLEIAKVLKQKKAEGLDVRVIVDAFSNPWLQTQWMLFDLKQHGIEVEGYEALALQWLNEIPVPLLTPYSDPAQLNKRYHEKLWLIDAESPRGTAIVGGLNIGNEYFRVDPGNPDGYWRDQDVAVRGAIIGDMARAFDANFDYLVGIKESRGILNTNLYWDATRSVQEQTGKLPVQYSVDEQLAARVAALARESNMTFRPARCRFLHQRPRLEETYITQAYLKLITRSERELLIANAYFVPTSSLLAALEDAVRRCVSVKILSNSPETNDLPEISMVGRGYYARLLALNDGPAIPQCKNEDAGLQVWEWTGRAEGDSVQQGTMHAKFAVADRKTALVGSYNLDPRSERLNSESAIVFEEPLLVGQLADTFLHTDLRYSRRVTPAEAAEYAEPEDIIYRYRKTLGDWFEQDL